MKTTASNEIHGWKNSTNRLCDVCENSLCRMSPFILVGLKLNDSYLGCFFVFTAHITSACGKNGFTGCTVRSKTDCAAAQDLDAWDGFSMTRSSGADETAGSSIINLDFLRSGKEFVNSQNVEVANPILRNRNARLDDFYKRTLNVHQSASADMDSGAAESMDMTSTEHDDLDCWDGMPGPMVVNTSDAVQPTSVVNLQFLRSGAEFVNQASDQKGESTRPRAGSKNARLEAFHQRTLAAFDKKSD